MKSCSHLSCCMYVVELLSFEEVLDQSEAWTSGSLLLTLELIRIVEVLLPEVVYCIVAVLLGFCYQTWISLILYFNMLFMGGLFIWVLWCIAGEGLEGGNSIYWPYVVQIHAGVKISLLVCGKVSGCQFNISCFVCHNN